MVVVIWPKFHYSIRGQVLWELLLGSNAKHEMGCEWKWVEAVLTTDCKVATFLWLSIAKVCSAAIMSQRHLWQQSKPCFPELTPCSLAVTNTSNMFRGWNVPSSTLSWHWKVLAMTSERKSFPLGHQECVCSSLAQSIATEDARLWGYVAGRFGI